ncbi:hypothetical protein DBR06_SOUSAS6810159, partial [Sousa chinensis]
KGTWSPSPARLTRLSLPPAGPDRTEIRQPEAEGRERRPHQGHQQAVQVGQALASRDGAGPASPPAGALRPRGATRTFLWPSSSCRLCTLRVPSSGPRRWGSDSFHQSATAIPQPLEPSGGGLGVARPAVDPASGCRASGPRST